MFGSASRNLSFRARVSPRDASRHGLALALRAALAQKHDFRAHSMSLVRRYRRFHEHWRSRLTYLWERDVMTLSVRLD